MVSDADLKIIREISLSYSVGRVLLFGSSLANDKKAHDIDLAVQGIAPAVFFAYYGDLMMSLSKPVDVVDISAPSKFNTLILREGVPIYG